MWFGSQPVQPFQAAGLHPGRSAWNRASVVIERGADPDHYGVYPSTMFCHPLLLLGAAEADKQETDPAGFDAVADFIILILSSWRNGGETQ